VGSACSFSPLRKALKPAKVRPRKPLLPLDRPSPRSYQYQGTHSHATHRVLRESLFYECACTCDLQYVIAVASLFDSWNQSSAVHRDFADGNWLAPMCRQFSVAANMPQMRGDVCPATWAGSETHRAPVHSTMPFSLRGFGSTYTARGYEIRVSVVEEMVSLLSRGQCSRGSVDLTA